MERCWQSRWTNLRTPTTRLDESESIEPLNLLGDSDAPIEVEQVGAASEKHMLTVVYGLAGSRMLIGRSPATDERSALEETHWESRIGQCASGRESGNASANDSDS